MMLTKNDEFIKTINDEIQGFSHNMGICNNTPFKDELECIIKQYYFIKSIIELDFNKHYVRALNMDILMTLDCLLKKSSLRNFHYNYRSLLENLVRVTLELDDSDEMGVNQLFKKLDQYCKQRNLNGTYDLLSEEYGNSCFYVHSNIKKQSSIIEYLSELESFDDLTAEKENIIPMFVKVFESIVTILIENKYSLISGVYNRKNTIIEYLVTEANYEYFLNKKE